MSFIFNFFYFIFFIVFVFVAMFLGGVTGSAGTFYIMIEKGDMQQNLTIVITALVALWLIGLMLSSHNKKVIKRNKLQSHAQQEPKKQAKSDSQSDAEKVALMMAQNQNKFTN